MLLLLDRMLLHGCCSCHSQACANSYADSFRATGLSCISPSFAASAVARCCACVLLSALVWWCAFVPLSCDL
jgi:hypothetical protein